MINGLVILNMSQIEKRHVLVYKNFHNSIFFIAESQRSLTECMINGVPIYCNMYLP